MNYDMRPVAEIDLDYPISLDGKETKTLSMRRPKVADRLWSEKLTGTDFEKVVKVAARLCDMSPEQIALLDDVDMIKIDQQYASFRGGVPDPS